MRTKLALLSLITLTFSASCVSTGSRAAFASARAARLDAGFFFGHDVRLYRSVVFVLDLSGSMSERSGSVASNIGTSAAAGLGGALVSGFAGREVGSAAADTVGGMDKKVELVKDHLIASLRGLPAGSDFNVILFSDGIQKLAPGMITASGLSTTLVGTFISQLREGGSTNLRSAIEAGLATEAEEIMVLTDGLPTDASPESILAMVRAHQSAAPKRIYTVGVGSDQARDFLTRLAEENGGKYLAYE
jgi:hypothetical protein